MAVGDCSVPRGTVYYVGSGLRSFFVSKYGRLYSSPLVFGARRCYNSFWELLMACYTPVKAYWGPGGRIVFNSKQGYSDRPLEFSCGQCIGCRVDRSREWALRCVHESQLHKENCFITLTYDNRNLPVTGSLDVRAWQLFMKRLRKFSGSLRYFMCGEYGESKGRPHYHALLFGRDFHRDRVLLRESKYGRLYTSAFLSERWGMGFCTVGSLSYESAAYVARYSMKKLTGERVKEYEGRLPEFALMSRRPGIGAGWFDRFSSDVFPADEVVHGGRRFKPPGYYASKLPDEELEGLKLARRRKAFLRKEDNSPERLLVREKFEKAKLSLSVRKYEAKEGASV